MRNSRKALALTAAMLLCAALCGCGAKKSRQAVRYSGTDRDRETGDYTEANADSDTGTDADSHT